MKRVSKWVNLQAFIFATCLSAFVVPAFAESYHAELTADHDVAKSWRSQQTGSAKANLKLSDDGSLLTLKLQVTGVKLDELAAAGKDGLLGPIHIHNSPQGGPNFFVLQLPGKYKASQDGFTLTLTDWKIEAPMGGAKVTADFVVNEIRNGKAYIGLHTANARCLNSANVSVPCAAPATALSGQLKKTP